MASAALSFPIAFWTGVEPIATVSVSLACAQYVVTGLEDGLIWVFTICQFENTLTIKFKPTTLLIGHNARITALEAMLVEGATMSASEWILISASEDGEVKKWSLADGRCLQSNPDAFIGVPTYLGVISSLKKSGSGPNFIICAGTSNEACILDSTSLEVVRVWGGHLDWVYCTALPSDEYHQSRILSVSTDCKISIWVFDTSSLTVIKSKTYDICTKTEDSVVSLVSCRYEASRVALVTRSLIQVYSLQSHNNICCSIPCPEKEPFAGAEFISSEQIVLWTELGRVRVYSLRGPQLASEQIDVDVSTLSTDVRDMSDSAVQVSEFNIRLGYRPTVTILRSNELQYVLCLRNASVGLEYSLARLPCGDNDEQAPHIYESHIQWDFNSAGPILKPSISCSMMLTDVLIALGDISGHVWIISVDQALLALTLTLESLPSEEIMILRGHVGAITTIFTSDDLMQRSFLMSGGEDCSARIWSIDSGAEIACFNNHSRPIAHFLQVPDDVNSRIRRSVISVAQDCSIAIISIEEMSCIYLFGGYEHALLSIQWRPSEDYIVLWYADATAFIWQMQTGHLDRTVRGDSAREIIMDPRWKNCDIVHTRSNSSKLAFDCITTWLSGTVCVQTIIVNLKQILSILAPARVAEQQDYIAVPNLASQPSNTADVKTPARRGMLIGQWRSSTKSKAKAVDQPVTRSDDIQKCLDAAKRILSLMITEDNAHAISIRNSLGLSQPVRSAAFGMRGAYGNISIQAPAHNCDTTSWCISPTMTASKLITILSLTKIVVSVCNLSVDMDIWPKDYCSAVQDSIGANYCPPSLSYLAKYWQDPQMEIQEAARIILLSTIERMSKAEISSLVKYWSVYLPAAALPDTCSSQYMARSAIILGIIGAENADALPETVRKLVALSLTILLNDDTRLSYRIASIDLLSQGFGSWQPFIRADAVLHTLFTMAMDSQSYNTLVSRRARRAIARIAAINPTLFVTTLTQDILDVKKQADRAGLLKLVSIFSRKNPAVLYKGIPRLTEAIVKSLDPIAPQARESLLPVATSVMMDLVHSFPQLDFHTGSQKLAVGTLEGAIVVYDLHTATRWQILEGHSKSVSAVSFSRDGETIVSCSIKERSVRFWHPSPGFFGMLMGGNSLWAQVKSTSVGGSKQSHSMTSLSSQQSSRKIDFALEDSRAAGSEESMLNHVRFEWTGDKAVKLSVYDHVMSLNI